MRQASGRFEDQLTAAQGQKFSIVLDVKSGKKAVIVHTAEDIAAERSAR